MPSNPRRPEAGVHLRQAAFKGGRGRLDRVLLSSMPYPGRLRHSVPDWVNDGAAFHIRMRAAQDAPLLCSEGASAQAILDAARFYHDNQRWFCRLFLVMPDHIHSVLVFQRHSQMSVVIGKWKGFLAKSQHIKWQPGFFDHRLRSRKEADECWRYIRQNPVRAGLTEHEESWPWAWWPSNILVPE